MIRPLTCMCMLLAGGSGLYLYQSKHQAQMLDREIARTLKETDTARERIGMLRGEWALLNEPDRLAALSQAHLGLRTLAPDQFVSVADLGARLPPPGALPAPTEEDAGAPPVAALAVPAPAPAVPPATPASPAPSHSAVAIAKASPVVPNPPSAPLPRAPAQVASALPQPTLPPSTTPLPASRPPSSRSVLAPVVNVSASPSAPPAPRPAQARTAQPTSPTLGTTPARLAAPTPDPALGDAVLQVAHHVPRPVPTTQAAASGYGPSSASIASVSALGGVRPLLPPPVPYRAAMAASGAGVR